MVTILFVVLAGCSSPQMLMGSAGSEAQTAEGAAETAIESSTGSDANGSRQMALLPEENPPSSFTTGEWSTDFSRRTVEWSEIRSGGPPKDGIPAIDNPTFESVDAAKERLAEQEPVIVFEHGGEAKAYPLSILIWHEIVNDTVGGKPIAVTFCPLCNASIVFDATFDGQVRDFGTTGRLRNSDLIMYDRQSETWWQQFTGEGIVGQYAGHQLTFLPSQVLSFGDFAERYADGQVLAIPASFRRQYGINPYSGYDSLTTPFLYRGEIDDRLPAMERVVGIELDDVVMAYAFEDAASAGAINDQIGETAIVIFHKDGTTSALDKSVIAESRDIGSVGVYNRQVGEQVLTFVDNKDGTFKDEETGSTWLITGEAVEGELAGTQLERIISFDHFWFAWAAFFPETGLFGS